MVQLTLVLDNLRSAYNVGTILRTCDAAGILSVLACGITPYPFLENDERDPVVANRNTTEIAKSALGSEKTINVEYFNDTPLAIEKLKRQNFIIYGLEQAPNSLDIFDFQPQFPAALVVGNEVSGLNTEVEKACNSLLEIPQFGHKESLNVAVAAGIAIYQFIE